MTGTWSSLCKEKTGRRWTCRTGRVAWRQCGPFSRRTARGRWGRSRTRLMAPCGSRRIWTTGSSRSRCLSTTPWFCLRRRAGGRRCGIVVRHLSHKEVRDEAAGSDCLAGARGDRPYPQRQDVPRAGRVGAASAACAGRAGGTDQVGRALVRAHTARPSHAGARKAGHAAGAAVPSCVLGHGPLSLGARPSPRTAAVVAAGRDRRHPLGAVGDGGGLAECGGAGSVAKSGCLAKCLRDLQREVEA